jgi:hypothetical protein
VLQTEVRGLSANTPTIVCARLFYSRSRAEKAEKAADNRLRIKVGNVSIGSRRPALLKLPIDARQDDGTSDGHARVLQLAPRAPSILPA